MEPEYAVGDILIVREKDPSTIKVGDNIVYVGNIGDYKGKIITHNVINIEQNEEGEYLFHTKGIANTIEDPIVNEKQLYGVVVHNNIILAWLCKILTNRYGLYFFVIIPIILFAFMEFVRVQGEKAEQERAEEHERKKRKKEAEPIQEEEETDIENIEPTSKPKRKRTTAATKKDEEKKEIVSEKNTEVEEKATSVKKSKEATDTKKVKTTKKTEKEAEEPKKVTRATKTKKTKEE